MSPSPIHLFQQYYQAERQRTSAKLPAACCLSTLGLDGYPNARFLSLKAIQDDHFILTGSKVSRKGLEMAAHPRAALTFWWPHTERQVRIQGEIKLISDELAGQYFADRQRAAQAVSYFSQQGQPTEQIDALQDQINTLLQSDVDIKRPDLWGGWALMPFRIEFLTFHATRFHQRMLYTRQTDDWQLETLQP